MIRVYTDMAADLFHIGHLNLLKRAKSVGDYLIVGVHSDEQIRSYKRDPVFKEEAPLIMTESFLKEHKIDFVVRGDDVSEELLSQQADPIRMGIMRYVPRTEGVSTSQIIKRIKNGTH